MNATTSQKKLPRPKPLLDYPNSPDSRLTHIKSQQNLLERTAIDETKIQQNLLRQIQQAKAIVNGYWGELQEKVLPKVAPVIYEDCVKLLYELERLIEGKRKEGEALEADIASQKSFPGDAYRDNKDLGYRFKSPRSAQFCKLSDEIFQQKEELISLQKEHRRKKKELEESKKLMMDTARSYAKLMSTGNKRILTYEEFLAKKQRSREEKEDPNQKSRRLTRKNLQHIKESLDNQEDKKNILNSTNLRDAESKRKIAESALRGLKKKHQVEIGQLSGKLQFLQDQNQQLDIKLIQKQKELKTAAIRFSQTKQPTQPKKTLKLARYSEPQL